MTQNLSDDQNELKPPDTPPKGSSIIVELVPLNDVSDERIGNELKWSFEKWQALTKESGGLLPQWNDQTHQVFKPVSRRLMVVLAHGDWKLDEFDAIYCGQHVSDFLNQGKPVHYQQMRIDNPHFEQNYEDVKIRNGRVLDSHEPELVMKRMEWANMNYILYQSLLLPFMCEDECRYVMHCMDFKPSVTGTF